MKAAVIASWKGPVPGREAESLALAQEFSDFQDKAVADGRIDSFHWFLGTSGPNFAVTIGNEDELLAGMDEPELKRLLAKSQIVNVDHEIHVYKTADGAQDAMNAYVDALKELGYV